MNRTIENQTSEKHTVQQLSENMQLKNYTTIPERRAQHKML